MPDVLRVGPYSWYELTSMPGNAQWLGMNIARVGGSSPTDEAMTFYATNNWEVMWCAGAPGEFSSYANQAAFNAAYLAHIDSVMNVYGPRGSFWSSVSFVTPASPITAIEIMNEPNIWFPFPGGNSHAPKYASALIAAYDHIKANWPEVQVVACSAMGAQAAAPGWINAVMDALIAAGRLDAFDVVSTHVYGDGSYPPEAPMYESWVAEPTRPISIQGSVANYASLPTGLTSGDAGKAWRSNADAQLYVWTGSAWPTQGLGQISWSIDASMEQVKQGLATRGVTRPLWITEVGWAISHADGGYYADTGYTDNLGNPPYVSSLALQAAYEVRMAMASARIGIDRVYYMSVADTDGTNFGWFNTDAGSLAFGTPGASTAAPRPVAVAMRQLNRLISGATQFDVVIDGSSAPETAPYAYRFTTPRGRVTVAWNQGGSTTAIPIDPDTAMVVTDQVGVLITMLPAGTTSYTATLSATPIFISPAGSSGTPSLSEQCEQIWRRTRETKNAHERLRREPPVVRLWDAEWQLQHVISGVEYDASFQWISNDTGPGQITIPFEHPAAQWVHDSVGRVERGEGRNVHITVDYCGARWSGRLDKAVVESREDGDTAMVLDFAHDYENLKFYSVWSNPFLGSPLQYPRAWLLAGPVTWVLLTTLHLQLFREHNPLVTVPDDPGDRTQWDDAFDMSNWSVVTKPLSFAEARDSGVVWGVVSSRWANWHDMAKTLLEDSELSVVCTRWLEGDPPAWDGANLRHGTLVISIEDKSGVHVGTSNGGSKFDGLRRTVQDFADDFIDSTQNVLSDSEVPTAYYIPKSYGTDPEWPYVVYRSGEGSGIQVSKFTNSPAKAVQINAGGHSMPGVNEAISATIQGVADLFGQVVLIGSLGGSIDSLLKPLYEDTILAWWSFKSPARAANSGWSRYFEFFQDGANKAYTIASLMVVRAGMWSTKTVIANEMSVIDGAPFLIAPGTAGHWFLDDRIGFALEDDPSGLIWIDRARKIELKWNAETYPEWVPTIGDPRNLQDPAVRAWGKIEQMLASLRDLGVF